MGTWGTKPWESDSGAEWFAGMMQKTGLANYVEETLHREIDEDFPGDADEIRAAATILVLLGIGEVWPEDDRERHLELAISRLEEILSKGYGGGATQQIRAEIAVMKSRLESKATGSVERVKWWHFDEYK
jgi:hypothetical protein